MCRRFLIIDLFSEGADYTDPLVTTVRLSQENSFEEVLIPIVDDRLFEGPTDEQFTVRISLPSCNSPGGLIIENAEATVSIEDNDIRPGVHTFSTLL